MIELTTTEMARLTEWLKANGFTSDQVLECLAYIAGTHPPK